MTKSLFLAGFLCTNVLLAIAQQNNAIFTGRIDSLQSRILKEERIAWVHLPPSAQAAQQPPKKYPVVYLLDGDKNFTSVVGMIDLLSSVNGNSVFPEMIVVGILNTNRMRDLTPTRVTSGLWVDDYTATNSGGGEAFTQFLEKELIPHIDSLYPTTTYRMLIGHSLGGLIAMNTLLHHPKLFSSYVAIDPSMWWDQQKLLHETEQSLNKAPLADRALFLGMAHTQSAGMDTTALQHDTTDGTLHPRSILQLSRYIMNSRQSGLQANYKYYDAETHTSVPVIATYDALHFIFKDYQLIFQDNYFNDSSFQLASFIKDYYAHISSKYGITSADGHTLLPPEDLLNNLGFFVLGKKQFTKAEAMFTMNTKNYPGGFMAYSYLGDLFAAKGDRTKAVANYKKSLSLKEDAGTRKKLEKLQ